MPAENLAPAPAWWTFGHLWLVISGPLVVVVASFITLYLAVTRPDPVLTEEATIKVEQGTNRMFLFKPGVELEQIVRAVNEVGAAPGDLVAILEALREAGALQAELIVI